jgi:Ycf66 protein N-terminus
MVNIGFSLTTLLGLLDLLGVICYFLLAIYQISRGVYSYSSNSIFNTGLQVIEVLELISSPIALFLSGIILVFNGWRLDPILQFQQLLLHVIIGLSFTKMLGQSANSSR